MPFLSDTNEKVEYVAFLVKEQLAHNESFKLDMYQ